MILSANGTELILPPILFSASSITTFSKPFSTNLTAADTPANPAPIITILGLSILTTVTNETLSQTDFNFISQNF